MLLPSGTPFKCHDEVLYFVIVVVVNVVAPVVVTLLLLDVAVGVVLKVRAVKIALGASCCTART